MSSKPKSSIMYDYTILSEAVQGSNSIKECFRKMGLRPSGSSYKIFYKACEEHGIVPPKATGAYCAGFGRRGTTRTLEEILVENSTYATPNLKKRLVDANLLEEQCTHCGVGPIWNDKPLRLQVDHINGVGNDHRLENLRLLCPNCHSQTDTWCGKHNKIKKDRKRTREGKLEPVKLKDCSQCDTKITPYASVCLSCYNTNRETKITWPTDSELLSMLANSNYVQVGKKLGVSDNAIRRRMKVRNICTG